MAEEAQVFPIPAEYRPAGMIGPPEYNPVSYDNIETDEFYIVRGTMPSLSIREMMVFVDTKTADRVRAFLFALRPLNRVFSMEKLIEAGFVIPDGEQLAADQNGRMPKRVSDVEEYAEVVVSRGTFRGIFDDHPRANEVFYQLPLRAGDWEPQSGIEINDEGVATIAPGTPVLRFPFGREFVHMEHNQAASSYVFLAPVAPEEAAAAAPEGAGAAPEPIGGGRRRRRHTRRRRATRRQSRRHRRSR
jgi:hypothetical protein